MVGAVPINVTATRHVTVGDIDNGNTQGPLSPSTALGAFNDSITLALGVSRTNATATQNTNIQPASGLFSGSGRARVDFSSQEFEDFSFDEVTGYRRIIDFKDRASDNGLYNLGGQIDFFPFTTGTGIFSPGTPVDIVVSRDSVTSEFNVYAEGANILTFVDSASDGVFSAANNVINFFRDDLDFPNEASAGFVDFIRIFDTPLTATQVSCLQTQSPVACGVQIPGPNVVPEPGTLALLSLVGLGFAAFGLRRKQD